MSRTCSACIEPCGTAHECKDCGTPLCEKVWMPLEGKYFCGNACVVAYNRKKVEEYEEWLEMLPEKGEAEGTAPATIKVRTGGLRGAWVGGGRALKVSRAGAQTTW